MNKTDSPERLVAIIRRPYTGAAPRHYIGVPPMGGRTDTRERMRVPRVLVIDTRADGIFLDRYDEDGEEAGDTWHQSVEEAKKQADTEYGENAGPWTEVPEDESDLIAFALRLAEA
jgi:hypothetical protein